jgi:hypothetical protein
MLLNTLLSRVIGLVGSLISYAEDVWAIKLIYGVVFFQTFDQGVHGSEGSAY